MDTWTPEYMRAHGLQSARRAGMHYRGDREFCTKQA